MIDTSKLIKTTIAQLTGAPVESIFDENELYGELQLDLLAVIETVMIVEEALSIEVTDEDIEAAKTVQDLITTIDKTR